jgi:hypothetical protein
MRRSPLLRFSQLATALLQQQAVCCAAAAAGTGPCQGPIKCASAASLAGPAAGGTRFCVGFEGSSVYCYGETGGCMWGSTECTSDVDCEKKYSAVSPKYTDHDVITCPSTAGAWTEADCKGSGAAGLPAALRCGWRTDACTCERPGAPWGWSFIIALAVLSVLYTGGGIGYSVKVQGVAPALGAHPHMSIW